MQALKQHKEALKQAGVESERPRPLPREAIRPAGRGPDPEDVARKKAEQRRMMGSSRSTSTSWSAASSKEGNAPSFRV